MTAYPPCKIDSSNNPQPGWFQATQCVTFACQAEDPPKLAHVSCELKSKPSLKGKSIRRLSYWAPKPQNRLLPGFRLPRTHEPREHSASISPMRQRDATILRSPKPRVAPSRCRDTSELDAIVPPGPSELWSMVKLPSISSATGPTGEAMLELRFGYIAQAPLAGGQIH